MAQFSAPAPQLRTLFVRVKIFRAPKQDIIMQQHKINEIADKIESLLPSGIRQVKDDFDDKLKKVLQQQLTKMDFVSREEFDIQSKVLARTREKLEQLEKRVEELSK